MTHRDLGLSHESSHRDPAADDTTAGGLGTGTPRKHHHTATRPMTSGERQYRTGCRRGYITQGCDQFAAPRLLHHGIDPYL